MDEDIDVELYDFVNYGEGSYSFATDEFRHALELSHKYNNTYQRIDDFDPKTVFPYFCLEETKLLQSFYDNLELLVYKKELHYPDQQMAKYDAIKYLLTTPIGETIPEIYNDNSVMGLRFGVATNGICYDANDEDSSRLNFFEFTRITKIVDILSGYYDNVSWKEDIEPYTKDKNISPRQAYAIYYVHHWAEECAVSSLVSIGFPLTPWYENDSMDIIPTESKWYNYIFNDFITRTGETATLTKITRGLLLNDSKNNKYIIERENYRKIDIPESYPGPHANQTANAVLYPIFHKLTGSVLNVNNFIVIGDTRSNYAGLVVNLYGIYVRRAIMYKLNHKIARFSCMFCAACFLPISSDNVKRLVKCSHMFHGACVEEMETCPLCETDVDF